ncbi:uncharacterized protein [Musca autumnalis]|uniref:uncharacterized protein n=1 Tax=Musca autumnalis TaxID=221902 RepID=UPI003CEB3611
MEDGPVSNQSQSTLANDTDPKCNQQEIENKTDSLIELATSTFQAFCKALDGEQTKLLDLEEKRKELQGELLVIKSELENLYALSKGGSIGKRENSKTEIFSDTKQHEPTTSTGTCMHSQENAYEPTEPTADEHTINIKQELQKVLEECVREQNIAMEKLPENENNLN